VVNELKACGVNDILIAVVDKLKGFSEGECQKSWVGASVKVDLLSPCIENKVISGTVSQFAWSQRAVKPQRRVAARRRCGA
jgi:hypothetical protein